MTRIDHRELLDASGEVVGYVDADGVAHEFAFDNDEEEVYPLEEAADRDKTRIAGEPLILPEGMADLVE